MNFGELAPIVAALAGVLIGIFTALKLIAAGVEYLFSTRRRYTEWKHKRTLVLFATVEEIAKYSVKAPDRHSATQEELNQDVWRGIFRQRERLTKSRMALFRLFSWWRIVGLLSA